MSKPVVMVDSQGGWFGSLLPLLSCSFNLSTHSPLSSFLSHNLLLYCSRSSFSQPQNFPQLVLFRIYYLKGNRFFNAQFLAKRYLDLRKLTCHYSPTRPTVLLPDLLFIVGHLLSLRSFFTLVLMNYCSLTSVSLLTPVCSASARPSWAHGTPSQP